jgi:hypothetical protein
MYATDTSENTSTSTYGIDATCTGHHSCICSINWNTYTLYDEPNNDEWCISEDWVKEQELIAKSQIKDRSFWKSNVLDQRNNKHPKWGMSKPRR